MKKKRGKRIPRSRPLSGQEQKKPMDPWDLADWRHAGLAASTMFPFGVPKPTPEQMIEELREILAGCPAYYPALLDLGFLEAAAGRTDEARKHLLDAADRMAEREPQVNDELTDNVGGIAERLEEGILRYDLMRDLMERLVQHYPQEPQFKSDLGEALVFLGEFDKAIRNFKEALALAPEDPRNHSNLGWALLEAGRPEEARPHLERALQLDPEDAYAAGNFRLLTFLEGNRGTVEDYLARPMDPGELQRWDTEFPQPHDVGEAIHSVDQWNHDRLQAWQRHVCRTWKDPRELELFKTVRAFFPFLEKLSLSDYTLYEDVVLLESLFETVMRRFILQMSDADQEIVEEVCDGLLAFHSYLARKGVVDQDDFADLQSRVQELKPTLVEKADRYAAARHDPSLTEAQKDRIRRELFGDL